jgi:hypothetical protein
VKTLVLGGKDLEKILSMELAIPAVERAFAAHGRGEVLMPPKLYLPLEKYSGDFRAMPACMGDAAGVKWVNMHPENPKRFNLPAVMGVYILSDPETAFPLSVMDGTRLTSFRRNGLKVRPASVEPMRVPSRCATAMREGPAAATSPASVTDDCTQSWARSCARAVRRMQARNPVERIRRCMGIRGA